MLKGISQQKIRDQRQSEGEAQGLTSWKGFHGRGSGIKDRAEENHRDSQAERDFMAGDQRPKTELRRSTGTHKLKENSWQDIRDQRQS